MTNDEQNIIYQIENLMSEYEDLTIEEAFEVATGEKEISDIISERFLVSNHDYEDDYEQGY